jgi:hypothetical protein
MDLEQLMTLINHAFGRCILVSGLVAGMSLSFAQAQSANQTLPSDWLLLAKKGPLLTYDDGKIPKDGYKIVPPHPSDPNFVECDASMLSVDEKLLTTASAVDCGAGDGPGMLEAYINAVGANGDVHLVTPQGNQIIGKIKWNQLTESLSKTSNPKADINVGDFTAILKDERGEYATMFKLAPGEAGRGG